jgi:hypothetical protein
LCLGKTDLTVRLGLKWRSVSDSKQKKIFAFSFNKQPGFMKKITKRDVLFFFLGIFTFFIIESVWDWDNTVKSFKEGWNAGSEKAEMEQMK